MAKPGRPRKFKTAASFRKAVDGYFDAICYDEPVTRKAKMLEQDKKTGEMVPVRDSSGHEIYREEPVLLVNGQEAARTCWVEAPSVTGLCLTLGISRETWSRYAEEEEFCDTVTRARARVEDYLIQQLGTKAAQGAKFSLQYNYGWKERMEVSTDEGTRKAMATASMSMEEKLNYLQRLQEQAGNIDADGGA